MKSKQTIDIHSTKNRVQFLKLCILHFCIQLFSKQKIFYPPDNTQTYSRVYLHTASDEIIQSRKYFTLNPQNSTLVEYNRVTDIFKYIIKFQIVRCFVVLYFIFNWLNHLCIIYRMSQKSLPTKINP